MIRLYKIVCIVALLLIVVSAAVAYPFLPERIPTHWNFRGEVDGYGGRLVVFMLPVMELPLVLLFWAIPWLSPRHFKVDEFQSTYWYIVALINVLMTYIHGLLLCAYLGVTVRISTALMVGMFLFFAAMGNVLGKVKKNFFVGVRTPWTLASDRVWNETHRLAAWLFTAGGLGGALACLLGAPLWLPLAIIIPAALVPVVYSLIRYKQLEGEGKV